MMVFLFFGYLPANHYQLIFLAFECRIIHYLFSFFNAAPSFDLINMYLIILERFELAQIYLKKLMLHPIVGEGLLY